MDHAPTVAILALALLTAPALAGGLSGSTDPPQSDVWLPEDKLSATEPWPDTEGPSTVWVTEGKISGEGFEANLGMDVDMAAGTSVVGLPGEGLALVLDRNGFGWDVQAELTPDGGPAAWSGFGSAVAINSSGETIVVGAPWSSTVHVFEAGSTDGGADGEEEENGGWSHVAALSAGGTGCLGRDVVIDDGVILAGAPCDAEEVHVFERQSGELGWVADELIEGDTDRFGWSLALDDDTAVIASMGSHIELHQKAADGWEKVAILDGAHLPTTLYGASVDLDEDVLLVGAPLAWESSTQSGAAYVYQPANEGSSSGEAGGSDDTGAWQLSTTLLPGDVNPAEPATDTWFGMAVSVDADRIAVGAPGDDNLPMVAVNGHGIESERDPVCGSLPLSPHCQRPGAVFVFVEDDGAWERDAKLTAPDGAPAELPRWLVWSAKPDAFGSSIALVDDDLIAGAPEADHLPGDEAGAAYLFARQAGIQG